MATSRKGPNSQHFTAEDVRGDKHPYPKDRQNIRNDARPQPRHQLTKYVIFVLEKEKRGNTEEKKKVEHRKGGFSFPFSLYFASCERKDVT